MAVSTIKGATKQSISANNFITVNSGFTVSNVEFVQQGNLLVGRFIAQRNVETGANSTITIGTLTSAYRPRVICGVMGATYRGLINANGEVIVRPYNTVNANSAENIAFIIAL